MIRGVEGYSDMFSRLPDSKIATRSMSSNFDPMVDFRVWAKWTFEFWLEHSVRTKWPRLTMTFCQRSTVPCSNPGQLREL